MSDKHRARIATGLAVLLAPLLLLSSASGEAENPGEREGGDEGGQKETSVLPRLSVHPSRPAAPYLMWRDGRRIPGTLTGAGPERLSWNHVLFTEPMRVWRDAVVRVDLANAPEPTADGFRIIFADGSNLAGELESFDADSLVFTSSSGGTVRARRDQVVAVDRLRGAGLLAGGASHWLREDAISKGRHEKLAPAMAPAGEVVFLEFESGANQELALPEKCLVELRLRIEDEPALALDLAGAADWITLETWDDELVLVHGTRFSSAGPPTLQPGGGLELRLAWDRPARRAVLFAPDGSTLAELTVEGPPRDPVDLLTTLGNSSEWFQPFFARLFKELKGKSNLARAGRRPGITLTNRGAGFVVERYRVSAWSGEAPPAIDGKLPRVETAGAWIDGGALTCDDGTVTIRSAGGASRQLPLAEIRALHWAPQPTGNDPAVALAEVWLHDGALLRGVLLEAPAGELCLQTAFAEEPVVVSLASCRALIFPPAKDDPAPSWELDKLDVIAAGKQQLHGTIKGDGRILPSFHPAGCESALVPRPLAGLTLTRNLSATGPLTRSPVLLHTTGQESLPADSFELDGEAAHLAWPPAANARQLNASVLHAVQFPVPAPTVEKGFADPGWEFLGRGDALPELHEGAIILKPNTGIGHPSLLQGRDFQFRLGKESQLTSIRIRLFCQGTERNSDSLSFLVAHSGGQIHGGREREQDGQLESNHSLNLDAQAPPVTVSFRFSGNTVTLLVNGQRFAEVRFDNEKHAHTGAGLVIETTSVWGNQIGPAKLSEFRIAATPGQVGPPPFSSLARRECLLLPRLRREPPPRHILVGRNGDLLRGDVRGVTGENLLLRAGLNNLEIPRSRLAALVWVGAADQEMEANVPKASETGDPEEELAPQAKPGESGNPASDEADPPAETGDSAPAEASDPAGQWIDLTNGGRLRLQVEPWQEDVVRGQHALLGPCAIPIAMIERVSLTEPAVGAAWASLAGWKFEHTIDPNPPGLDEADVSPLVGKPAPDFTLATLDGGNFTLSAARGRVVVLDFWATWCAPCVRSLPALNQTMAAFPADQVTFLTINEGETRGRVQRFLETRQLELPVAFDPDLELGRKYEAEAIPYTVVVDAAGMVVHVAMGAGAEAEQKIAAAVTRALQAAPAAEEEAGDAPAGDAPNGQ